MFSVSPYFLTKLLAEVPTYKFSKKHQYFRWGRGL